MRRLTFLLTAALLTGPALAQTQTAPAQPAAPLTLDAALARLSQSPSVVQAALSVKVAQDNLNAARTALGLTVSVTGNASYTGPYTSTASDGSVTTAGSTLSGSAGAQVSLGLLPWASNQTSLRQAQRALGLSQAQLRNSEASTQLNVIQQYFNAVLATEDAGLAARTLALRQRQLTVAQAQLSAGNATAESVLNAQANVVSAQGTGVQAAANLDSARRSLSATLGSDLGAARFDSRPAETFTLPDLTALVARARANRVEVITAANDLQAAQDSYETQQRETAFPDVTASLRYGPAGGGGLTASLNLQQGTAGLGYSLPLGGTDNSAGNRVVASVSGSYVVYSPTQKAVLSAAQAGVTQAQLALNVQQQAVELDVRSKYNAAQTALLSIQKAESALQVAQSALDAARLRLQAGTVTADPVTEAELTLAQAERDRLAARVSTQIALLTLENAAPGAK